MNLLVDRATARDMTEAEALMREVLESDLGGYVPTWHNDAGRRQGVGRSLVQRAALWATREAGYATVYLHTNASAPGAEPFWRSLPTVEMYDARPDPFNCVHFEIDVDKLCTVVPTT